MWTAVTSIPRVAVSLNSKDLLSAHTTCLLAVSGSLCPLKFLLRDPPSEASIIWNVSRNHDGNKNVANVTLTLKDFLLEIVRHHFHSHFFAPQDTRPFLP